MNFKRFLEAEYVSGQRYPTTEAIWHLLTPLANSKQHLVSLGEPVEYGLKFKQRKQTGRLLPFVNQTQGTRDPLETGTGEYTLAVGVRTFMNQGLQAFQKQYTSEDDKDHEILHILKVNNINDVWTTDPKINQKNPWLIMNTHWNDLQHEFQTMMQNPKINVFAKSRAAANEWESLSKEINQTYRKGSDSHNWLGNLRELFDLIYVEAPRLLKYVKSGMSYAHKYGGGTASYYQSRKDIEDPPEPFDVHYPKAVTWDFKIISQTLPLTDTPWALILSQKAVTQENTALVPATFKGFQSAEPQNVYANASRAFHAPNARIDKANELVKFVQEHFTNEVVPLLERFLEELDEAALEGVTPELKRIAKYINREMTLLDKVLARISKIAPEFKIPDNLRDAIKQYEDHGYDILRNAAENNDNSDDEETFDQYERHIEKASTIFQKTIDDLSLVTHR